MANWRRECGSIEAITEITICRLLGKGRKKKEDRGGKRGSREEEKHLPQAKS